MTERVHTSRLLGAFALLGILALGGQTAPAEDGGKGARPTVAREEGQATVAGMKVAIDPATGRMRPPTAEESARLRAGMREFFAGLEARSRAARRADEGEAASARPSLRTRTDGKLSALVGTDKLQFTVLTLGPDGSRRAACVSGPAAADRQLTTGAPAPERE